MNCTRLTGLWTVVLLGFSAPGGGCAAPAPAVPDALTSVEALVIALRAQTATVQVVERLPLDANPFFSVPAVVLSVNGENVSVFQYLRASDADREAATIAPDGSGVGTSRISWIGPPRFYKKDNLIVLYVGSNPAVITPLEAVLGERIAGR